MSQKGIGREDLPESGNSDSLQGIIQKYFPNYSPKKVAIALDLLDGITYSEIALCYKCSKTSISKVMKDIIDCPEINVIRKSFMSVTQNDTDKNDTVPMSIIGIPKERGVTKTKIRPIILQASVRFDLLNLIIRMKKFNFPKSDIELVLSLL